MRKSIRPLLLLAAASLALSACSKQADEQPSADASAGTQALKPSSKSLPDTLDDADGLQTVAEALKETGIGSALKGKGSYTLLAPEDDAFARLGEAGKALTQSDDHAALAALLKAHLLPGYVTPQDIGAAIDASKDRQVSMASLSGQVLRFTRAEGGKIAVTAADGSTATLDGNPVAGGASIAIPINGVLKKV